MLILTMRIFSFTACLIQSNRSTTSGSLSCLSYKPWVDSNHHFTVSNRQGLFIPRFVPRKLSQNYWRAHTVAGCVGTHCSWNTDLHAIGVTAETVPGSNRLPRNLFKISINTFYINCTVKIRPYFIMAKLFSSFFKKSFSRNRFRNRCLLFHQR